MENQEVGGISVSNLERAVLWLASQDPSPERDWLIRKLTSTYAEVPCAHCGKNYRGNYMVLAKVWKRVMPSDEGHLHLECLEKKLGRALTQADFTKAPVNDGVRFGFLRGLEQGSSLKEKFSSGPKNTCV